MAESPLYSGEQAEQLETGEDREREDAAAPEVRDTVGEPGSRPFRFPSLVPLPGAA